jgi:hypothetical protein
MFKKRYTLTATRKKGWWRHRENRRQFLIDLATSKGLDPFTISTWQIITKNDIQTAGVCIGIAFIYSLT